MRKPRILIAGLLALALVLSACAVQVQAPAETSAGDIATYADANGLFTADYPSGWYVEPYGFTERFGMPFPNVLIGTSKEVMDLSSVEQLLPEGEIGLGMALMPKAMFTEMGMAEDAPLDVVAEFAATALSAGDMPDIPGIEVITLANGTQAAQFRADGETESAWVIVQELGDGVVLFAPSVVAPGYRNETLEAQVADIVASLELTGSLEDVVAVMEANMMADAPDAGQPGTAAFTATEYAFAGPESIPAGVTEVVIQNEGELPHSLWLVKLEDGKGLEDLMGVFAAMETDPAIPEWIVFHGGTSAGPGESSSYWIDLPAGQYAMFSFDSDEEGVPDFAKGMVGELTVTEADSDAVAVSLPEPDATVELVDFSFVISPEFGSGEQLVEVTNTGMEPHEMAIMRLAPGVTADQVMEMMMSEEMPEGMEDGPPPFEEAAIIAPIAAGMSALVPLNLEPGEYLLLCFIPSPANENAPHLALGMVRPLTLE